jgi:hypothetical protein
MLGAAKQFRLNQEQKTTKMRMLIKVFPGLRQRKKTLSGF